MNDNTKMCRSDTTKLEEITPLYINVKATKISKRCVFVLVTWPWRLREKLPEACGSLTVVGAGTMHGFRH